MNQWTMRTPSSLERLWQILTTTLALTGCCESQIPVTPPDRPWTSPPADLAPVTSSDMRTWKAQGRFAPFAGALFERDEKLAEWREWYTRNTTE